MRSLTIYEADDGARFDSVADCKAHEGLCREVADIMAPLGVDARLPSKAYIRHDAEVVKAARLGTLRLAGPAVADAIPHVEAGKGMQFSIVGRILDDYRSPVTKAWGRLCCIDDEGREWQQPYFVANPDPNATDVTNF